MNYLKFIALTALLTLTSCLSQKRIDKICANCPTRTTIKDSVTVKTDVVVRDSIVTIPADSAWYKLWLACDSAGNVVTVRTEIVNGTNTKIEYITKDNYIETKCLVDSQAIALKWLERHTVKTEMHTEQSVIQKSGLGAWGKFFFHFGRVMFWLMVICIALTIWFLIAESRKKD